MPTNRDLLIARRRKEKGLPAPINKTVAEPPKDFSRKVNKVPTFTGKTGFQTRGTEGIIERPEPIDTGLATKGIKDIATPIGQRFAKDELVEEVSSGIPSNVSIASQTAKGTASQIARDRASKGLGGVSSFGLPTDRLPSFAELGGAIGQMFKFVGGLTKKRQALGLIPGSVNIPTKDKGLSLTPKDRATILAKRLDDLTLKDDERASIKRELDAILNPAQAAEKSDIDTILSE